MNDDAATSSSPSSTSTPSSPSSVKPRPKMEGGNHADDWSFPRMLQRIQLPPGERLTSMEKMTFPYYFHDDDSAGNNSEVREYVNGFNVRTVMS